MVSQVQVSPSSLKLGDAFPESTCEFVLGGSATMPSLSLGKDSSALDARSGTERRGHRGRSKGRRCTENDSGDGYKFSSRGSHDAQVAGLGQTRRRTVRPHIESNPRSRVLPSRPGLISA